MEHHLMGPLLGNIIILVGGGLITLGCYVYAIWLLIHPGEHDQRHPKYGVLDDDR
ncbi:MAG: hypothetical protein KGL98_09745 [Gammaproteobacteria bacterium]|nr:hypothetical protein [Gammaproteobacteria bacterium]MBU6508914.1 hypothetical protein [Gammaproteobacteria bacterium]MDE1983344.1 hypothetical protein [Gammaproteobacteria bacterium]MDE2108096.1 hypothetical protein [Gammaproteobacteria bacterium]MDE2461520.1 hypothetical protein [Gammaproteobacteria bacterium]